jgi:hypothetical protein
MLILTWCIGSSLLISLWILLFVCSENNSKKLWSYIKHKKQDSSGVAPLKDTDGLLHSDTPAKPEIISLWILLFVCSVFLSCKFIDVAVYP